MTLAVFHFDGILDVVIQVERKACSQEIASWLRFFRYSVWTLSLPGALPFFRDFSAVSTSSRVNASDIEVDSGVDWRSFLMSRLTEREWFLASALLSCHLPLLTSTDAMELAVTGHCFGVLLRPVSLLIVDQALRLEWVKLISDTSSSHLVFLISPSSDSRSFPAASLASVVLDPTYVLYRLSHSLSQHGMYRCLLPLGMESLAA